MAAKEEDGNVNADGNLAEAGEMDELLQEISDVLRSQGFFLFFRLLLRQCIYLVCFLCVQYPSNVFASELYICLSIKLILLRYLLFMKMRAT